MVVEEGRAEGVNVKRKALEIFGGKEVKAMLKFLDGKKTLLGVVIAVAPQVIDAVTQIMSAAGGDSEAWTKVAGGVLAVIGLIHKLLKG